MTFRHVLLCVIAALALASAAVCREQPIKDQATCYTTWDQNYFYLAFKVDSPDVRATQSKPNMDLTGDDSVEFYIETDNKHSHEDHARVLLDGGFGRGRIAFQCR